MKTKRIVDEKLLEQVRCLPCMACVSIVPKSAYNEFFDKTHRSHPHHVKTKKSGGGDTAANVIPLCFLHHREIHDHGISWVADRYKIVGRWLTVAGWMYSEMNGWILEGTEDE